MSKGGNFNRYWSEIVAAGRSGAGAAKGQKPQDDSGAKPGGRRKPAKTVYGQKSGKPGRPGRPGKPGGQAVKPLQPLKSGRPPKPPGAAPKEQLDGQGLPYITLVQFLKKMNLVDSGGAGKATVRAGGIQVNGSEEIRPARKLHQGDTVRFGGTAHTVTL